MALRRNWNLELNNDKVPYRATFLNDPATIVTADLNGFNTLVVTTTTAPSADFTLPTPPITDAGQFLTVINNDTSTDNIVVNDEVIEPGTSFRLEWDGDSWTKGGEAAINLADLNDVTILSEVNGDILAYDIDNTDPTIKLWKNKKVKSSREVYIDLNGDDDVNTGSVISPYATITKATSAITTGYTIKVNTGVHAGANITQANTSVLGNGHTTQITGDITYTPTGLKLQNIALTGISTFQNNGATGNWYRDVMLNNDFVAEGTGFHEAHNTKFYGDVSLSGAGGKYIYKSQIEGDTTIGTGNTLTYIENCTTTNVTCTAGFLVMKDCTAGGTNTITIGAGVVYSLQNVSGYSLFIDPSAISIRDYYASQSVPDNTIKALESSTFNNLRLILTQETNTDNQIITVNGNGILEKQDKEKVLQIADITADGDLTTADNLRDYDVFVVNQTTAGITASLLTPTDGKIRSIKVTNKGTEDIKIGETKLKVDTTILFLWDGNSWNVLSGGAELETTSIAFKFYVAGLWGNARSDVVDNIATVCELDDEETRISQGLVKMEGHGYVVGKYYYLTSTAGTYTNVKPSDENAIVQRVFYVVDADTLLIDIKDWHYVDNAIYKTDFDIKAVYHNGTSYALAQADSSTTLAELILVGATTAETKYKQAKVRFSTTHSFGDAGDTLYLSASTAGELTNVEPTGASEVTQVLGYVVDDKTITLNVQDASLFGRYEYVESTDGLTSQTSLTATKIKIASLTIPSNGIWNLYGEALIQYNQGSINWELRKNGVAFTNGGSDATYGDSYFESNDFRKFQVDRKSITLAENDLIELYIWETNDAAAFEGAKFKPFISAQKVSGFLPITDYEKAESGVSLAPYVQKNFSSTPIDFLSFWLPTPGTYKVDITASAVFTGGTLGSYVNAYVVKNSTGVELTESRAIIGGSSEVDTQVHTGNWSVIITTTTDNERYDVYGKVNTGTAYTRSDPALGRNRAVFNKISGNLPITQTTADISDIIPNADSGYVDIGNVRMQWGTDTSAISTMRTITLPVAFANTNYSVTANVNMPTTTDVSSNLRVVSLGNFTTTNFKAKVFDENVVGSTYNFSWIAIGLKP